MNLYCIFQAGHIEKLQLIRFWMAFFNKQRSDPIPVNVYMHLLEALVRGKSMDKPTEATKVFAKTFQNMLHNAGCLDAKGNIYRDKLQEAFENGSVDVKMLCSALGSQQLDSKFLDIKANNPN